MLYAVLTLSGKDSSLVLTGPFNARSYNNLSYKGTLLLKKKGNQAAIALVKKLEQLHLMGQLSFTPSTGETTKEAIVVTSTTATKEAELKKGNQFAEKNSPVVKQKAPVAVTPLRATPAAKLASRKIETVQTIGFVSDSIQLFLYDNGQVDGDTVSVILNGVTILPQQRLTEKAITYTIYTQPGMGDSLQLILYAENLGRIPPNTGLLVILDGEKRHEVRFSGDLQRNSAIQLKRQR